MSKSVSSLPTSPTSPTSSSSVSTLQRLRNPNFNSNSNINNSAASTSSISSSSSSLNNSNSSGDGAAVGTGGATGGDTNLKRKKSSLKDLRITVLGDRNVGKTAFLVRFITHRFIMDYDKGSDCFYKHELIIDQDTVLLDILDSSSPKTLNIKRFDLQKYQSTDLFLIIYSISDRQSFQYVRNLLKHLIQLKENNGLQLPCIAILANKSDLVHLRQVTLEEGLNLLQEFNELLPLIGFFGELSVMQQQCQQNFIEIYRWLKTKQQPKAINSPTTTTTSSLKPPINPPAPPNSSNIGIDQTKGNQNNNNNNNNKDGKSSPNLFQTNNNNSNNNSHNNNDNGGKLSSPS